MGVLARNGTFELRLDIPRTSRKQSDSASSVSELIVRYLMLVLSSRVLRRTLFPRARKAQQLICTAFSLLQPKLPEVFPPRWVQSEVLYFSVDDYDLFGVSEGNPGNISMKDGLCFFIQFRAFGLIAN